MSESTRSIELTYTEMIALIRGLQSCRHNLPGVFAESAYTVETKLENAIEDILCGSSS